jgi:hypothetical protein
LCNPVDKDGEGIINSGAHLTCYRIRKVGGDDDDDNDRDVSVENQFGPQLLEVESRRHLCVPSSKNDVE